MKVMSHTMSILDSLKSQYKKPWAILSIKFTQKINSLKSVVKHFFFSLYNNIKNTRKKINKDYRLKAVFPQGTSGDIARNTALEEKVI